MARVPGGPADAEDEEPPAAVAHRGEPRRDGFDLVAVERRDDLRRLGEKVIGK